MKTKLSSIEVVDLCFAAKNPISHVEVGEDIFLEVKNLHDDAGTYLYELSRSDLNQLGKLLGYPVHIKVGGSGLRFVEISERKESHD